MGESDVQYQILKTNKLNMYPAINKNIGIFDFITVLRATIKNYERRKFITEIIKCTGCLPQYNPQHS